ncbi:MAG: DUF1801 domain-containing protein [Flavobacteriales bacterium]|nr:DUF1801 domain-containing protein [Flavobacteriales bacterium]
MRQRTATTNRQAQSPEVRPTMLAGGLRFATVQECLDFLPPDERALTGELRELLLQEAPELKERISFNVPFYKVRRDICFLWPASVLWGNRKTYDGVRLGFSYGNLLQSGTGHLERGDRKQVCWRELTALMPADERMIRTLLREALRLDAERAGGLR